MACLKMAGAPAAQVSKGGARGFKDARLVCMLAHADEKWRCAKATVSQLKVPSSLRL